MRRVRPCQRAIEFDRQAAIRGVSAGTGRADRRKVVRVMCGRGTCRSIFATVALCNASAINNICPPVVSRTRNAPILARLRWSAVFQAL
jgi:hypothetical protein